MATFKERDLARMRDDLTPAELSDIYNNSQRLYKEHGVGLPFPELIASAIEQNYWTELGVRRSDCQLFSRMLQREDVTVTIHGADVVTPDGYVLHHHDSQFDPYRCCDTLEQVNSLRCVKFKVYVEFDDGNDSDPVHEQQYKQSAYRNVSRNFAMHQFMDISELHCLLSEPPERLIGRFLETRHMAARDMANMCTQKRKRTDPGDHGGNESANESDNESASESANESANESDSGSVNTPGSPAYVPSSPGYSPTSPE